MALEMWAVRCGRLGGQRPGQGGQGSVNGDQWSVRGGLLSLLSSQLSLHALLLPRCRHALLLSRFHQASTQTVLLLMLWSSKSIVWIDGSVADCGQEGLGLLVVMRSLVVKMSAGPWFQLKCAMLKVRVSV